MENLLVYLAYIYQGDYRQIKRAIEQNETYSEKEIDCGLKKIASQYVTILSNDYPKALRQLKDPPFVLFYYGDLSLASELCVAMIGMRQCSNYGKKIAQQLTEELKDDFVIVSGLAKGIDAVCHTYASKTIAVLGCGIDYCYPIENQQLYDWIKSNGLILSEYPNVVSPRPYYFPWRNRIVAALGDAVVVVEAKKKSGTMITVGYALDLGKPVFAVPYRLSDHTGTIDLIKDGAFCLESAKDIIEVLNLDKKY